MDDALDSEEQQELLAQQEPHDRLQEFMLLNRNQKYDTQIIVKLQEELQRLQRRLGWEPQLLRPQLSETELLEMVTQMQQQEQQLRDLLQIHQSHKAAMLSQMSLIAAV